MARAPSADFVPTAMQRRALEALVTYRLLSVQLMVRAGVGRDPGDIREALRVLVRKGWLDQTEAPLVSGVRRLPSLYWITMKGAEGCATLGLEIIGSRRRLRTMHEILHRLAIVETHIALRAWAPGAGVRVDWLVTDFEPGSAGIHKPTAVGNFVPDALASVTPPDGWFRMLVVEVERGGEVGDLHKWRRKLPLLGEVCRNHVVEQYFQSERGARFLVIFRDRRMAERALARWENPTDPVWGRFFVKSLDRLGEPFGEGWDRPGASGISLF